MAEIKAAGPEADSMIEVLLNRDSTTSVAVQEEKPSLMAKHTDGPCNVANGAYNSLNSQR